MPDYAGIKAAVAGLSDEAAIAALEAPLPVACAVPTAAWEGYLLTTGFLVPIQGYTTTPPVGCSAFSIGAAKTTMLLIQSQAVQSIDMTKPAVAAEVGACLSAFVAEGAAGRLVNMVGAPFTQANADALLGMGVVTTTRAAQLGLTGDVHVTANEVAAARIWPGVSE